MKIYHTSTKVKIKIKISIFTKRYFIDDLYRALNKYKKIGFYFAINENENKFVQIYRPCKMLSCTEVDTKKKFFRRISKKNLY